MSPDPHADDPADNPAAAGLARARVFRRRLTDVPFAAVFSILGINQAITFFARPGTQPAGLLASPLDYVWVAMYGAGGVLILAGIATVLANLEAGGCVLYGGAALISALATAVVRGWAAWNNVLVLLVIAVGALIRAYHLFRGRVLVLMPTAEDPSSGPRR